MLLPYWALLGTVDEEAVARLSSGHLAIRSVALGLEAQAASLEQVRELGDQLVAHIRFEERVLFALIEHDLGVDELTRLAGVVSEAEQER